MKEKGAGSFEDLMASLVQEPEGNSLHRLADLLSSSDWDRVDDVSNRMLEAMASVDVGKGYNVGMLYLSLLAKVMIGVYEDAPCRDAAESCIALARVMAAERADDQEKRHCR